LSGFRHDCGGGTDDEDIKLGCMKSLFPETPSQLPQLLKKTYLFTWKKLTAQFGSKIQ
jgi:hypothetical protein